MYLSLDMADFPLDRLPVTSALVDRLVRLNVETLVLSSEEEDLNFLRANDLEFDLEHIIMIELGWQRPSGLGLDVNFSIYGTGTTTDEAIEDAINQFYVHLEFNPKDPLNAFKET